MPHTTDERVARARAAAQKQLRGLVAELMACELSDEGALECARKVCMLSSLKTLSHVDGFIPLLHELERASRDPHGATHDVHAATVATLHAIYHLWEIRTAYERERRGETHA
jgi:hypothetical protein